MILFKEKNINDLLKEMIQQNELQNVQHVNNFKGNLEYLQYIYLYFSRSSYQTMQIFVDNFNEIKMNSTDF